MGAPIGYFSDQQPVDYPELNKCPDCETFFQTLTCPLCGKECPEEYRAGNRKAVKPKKVRYRNNSGRVQFIPWYHCAWVLVIALLAFPLVGLILLWQSSHSKGWKIAGSMIPVATHVVIPALISILGILFGYSYEPPIPTDRAEFVASCEAVDAEHFFRNAESYSGKAVKIELTVKARRIDTSDMLGYTNVYYECVAERNGRAFQFLLADCQAGTDRINLLEGDRITVYGTALGDWSIIDAEAGALFYPCVEMFFAELIPAS